MLERPSGVGSGDPRIGEDGVAGTGAGTGAARTMGISAGETHQQSSTLTTAPKTVGGSPIREGEEGSDRDCAAPKSHDRKKSEIAAVANFEIPPLHSTTLEIADSGGVSSTISAASGPGPAASPLRTRGKDSSPLALVPVISENKYEQKDAKENSSGDANTNNSSTIRDTSWDTRRGILVHDNSNGNTIINSAPRPNAASSKPSQSLGNLAASTEFSRGRLEDDASQDLLDITRILQFYLEQRDDVDGSEGSGDPSCAYSLKEEVSEENDSKAKRTQ